MSKKILQVSISLVALSVLLIPFSAYANSITYYQPSVYGYDEAILEHAQQFNYKDYGSGGVMIADDDGNLFFVSQKKSASAFANGGISSGTYEEHPYFYFYNTNLSMDYATCAADSDSFGSFQNVNKMCVVIGDGYIKEHIGQVAAAIYLDDSAVNTAYAVNYAGSVIVYACTGDYNKGPFTSASFDSASSWLLSNNPWGAYTPGGEVDVSGLKQAVVELQRKVKQIEATVSGLQDSVSTLQAEYDSVIPIVTEIRDCVDSINAKISNLKQDMNAGFSAVNDNIVGATNQIITTLEVMTNNLYAQFTRVVNAVIYGNEEGTRENPELTNDLEQFSGQLDGINGNISSASGYIDSAGADAADYIHNFSLFYEYTAALNGIGTVLTLGIVFIFIMKLIGR